LRHRAKRYNKRLNKAAGRGCIPNRVDIKDRPAIIEQKAAVGHWEGDLVMGPQLQPGALATYVERHSKFTKIAKVANKTEKVVTLATAQVLLPIAQYVQSITYDNGKEFAGHLDLSKTLQAQCFFATPYHSWERGLNEHTNGLIRQYFKKGTDLSLLTDEEVQAVEDALNDRLRKVLQYHTPREVFLQARLLC
jgi:IS30 family transposase